MTTTGKLTRWAQTDAPVSRLLDAIGVPELEYYSAKGDRAVGEALRAWPLLAAVAHTLRSDCIAQRVRGTWRREQPAGESDPTLRVIARNDDLVDGIEIEEADAPASSEHKAER